MNNHPYDALTPDVVMDALASIGLIGDGRLLALSSYENRVYQLWLEEPHDGESAVVAKFYRPGRWSEEQILEEHSFAAGYSACYIGAMKAVAGKMKLTLPADLAVDAEVDLGPIREGNAYGIAARLNVSLPGMDRAQAQQLIDAAHQVCPYSNATRGNIDVTLTLV